MAQMSLVLTADADEFRDRAWGFLEQRIDCNVLATVLIAVLRRRHPDVRPLFAYWLDASASVTAASLRTPPHPLITSALTWEQAQRLIDGWLAEDPDLPGANGEPQTARALAAAWRARTGGTTSLGRDMAMHTLEQVIDPPHPPAGRLRRAQAADRELLIDWWGAFADEAKIAGVGRATGVVDARLHDGGLFVWDHDGPVSFLSLSPSIAGVVRIGPVYTPPERRRRGYAGMAVAEASRHALGEGARACMLFTDLANPTSNKIYAEVGYHRVGDWEEHGFHRSPP